MKNNVPNKLSSEINHEPFATELTYEPFDMVKGRIFFIVNWTAVKKLPHGHLVDPAVLYPTKLVERPVNRFFPFEVPYESAAVASLEGEPQQNFHA